MATANPANSVHILWEDNEFTLRREPDPTGEGAVLVLLPVQNPAAAASMRKLQHELEIADALDSHWAVRPLALRRDITPALVLEDPGGDLLEQHLLLPMVVGDFLRLAPAIARALSEAHASGLVHRDVKPANIFIDAQGDPRLTGFGIASRTGGMSQAEMRPQALEGSLPYMAPEQTGRMNRPVDARSDLYSLGVTFYRMLTGNLPFSATGTLEWIHCHVARRPPPPSEHLRLPEAVSAIVMKLLSKTPEARYQSAAGVEADLLRCRSAWEQVGTIETFALGAEDRRERLLFAGRLYGRDVQAAALNDAFTRVAEEQSAAVVLISGGSGLGKTTLAHELRPGVAQAGGLFAEGKFDQQNRGVPYATLLRAFQGLIRHLLAMSETEIALWKNELKAALGSNGQLIVNLIPDLELVLGQQPPVVDLPPDEAPNRFRSVLRQFILAFAARSHPLALFLDDLQWADLESLDLLVSLMSAPDTRHLLLVGAFRDNEVEEGHPLRRSTEAFRQSGVRVDEIVLPPLSLDQIAALIADTLGGRTEALRSLARLVHAKTGGNPFFILQFIGSLEDQGVIAFDRDSIQWRWRAESVRASSITDNVAELVSARLGRLPGTALEKIKVMACLGDVVDEAALVAAVGTHVGTIRAELSDAKQAGLILRDGERYSFVHDRVREAAYALIPEAERDALHLRIGWRLLDHTPFEALPVVIFELVGQLNRGATLIEGETERQKLAELDLIAGRKARESNAYAAALTYLRVAAGLLGEDRWERSYALAFPVEFHIAECELLTGAMTEAGARLANLALLARSLEDRASVARLRIMHFQALDQDDKAVEVGLECLGSVVEAWTPHPAEDVLNREYAALWRNLAGRSVAQIANSPRMLDRDQAAILDVLTTLLPPTLMTDARLFRLVISRMVNMSLEHGHSDGSSLAYLWLSLILREARNDAAMALEFGRLGLSLAENGLGRFRARVLQSFGVSCIPWKEPLHAGLPFIERSLTAALEAGDQTFIAYGCQTARNRDPLSAPKRDPFSLSSSGEARSPQRAQRVAAG